MPSIWDQAEKTNSASVWDRAAEPSAWDKVKQVGKGAIKELAGIGEAARSSVNMLATLPADAGNFMGAAVDSIVQEDLSRENFNRNMERRTEPQQAIRNVINPEPITERGKAMNQAIQSSMAAPGQIVDEYGQKGLRAIGVPEKAAKQIAGVASVAADIVPFALAERMIHAGKAPIRELGTPQEVTGANLPDWHHPDNVITKDHDLLSNPEVLPAATDSASRSQAITSAVRDSENAPRTGRTKLPVGIEGEGAPESTSSVAREGVEVLEPRKVQALTENPEQLPAATDSSTVRPESMSERNPEQIPGRTQQGPSMENPQSVEADALVQQHNQFVAEQEQQKAAAIGQQQKATQEATQFIGSRVEQTFETPQGKENVKWKQNKEGTFDVTTTSPTLNGKSKSVNKMTHTELADYLKSKDVVTQEQYLGDKIDSQQGEKAQKTQVTEATSEPNAQKEKVVQPPMEKDGAAIQDIKGVDIGGKPEVKEPSQIIGEFDISHIPPDKTIKTTAITDSGKRVKAPENAREAWKRINEEVSRIEAVLKCLQS